VVFAPPEPIMMLPNFIEGAPPSSSSNVTSPLRKDSFLGCAARRCIKASKRAPPNLRSSSSTTGTTASASPDLTNCSSPPARIFTPSACVR